MALHIIYILYLTFALIIIQNKYAFKNTKIALKVNFENFSLLFIILVTYQLYYYLSH